LRSHGLRLPAIGAEDFEPVKYCTNRSKWMIQKLVRQGANRVQSKEFPPLVYRLTFFFSADA